MIADQIAARYSKLPTEILDLPIADIQINWLCLERGRREEERTAARNRKHGR